MNRPKRDLIHHLLAAGAVFLVGNLWISRGFGRPFWEVGGTRVWILAGIACSYLLAALILARRSRAPGLRLVDFLTAGVIVGAATFLPLLLPLPASRAALGLAFLAAVFMLALLFWVPRGHLLKGAVLVGVVGAAFSVQAAYGLGYLPRLARPSTAAVRTIPTSLYMLEVRRFSNVVPRSIQTGGALAPLWSDYLLATGDGRLYRFALKAGGAELTVTPLTLRIPTNPEDFRDEARSLGLQEEWFRVADIHTVVEDERVRLLATHHFWRADQQCFTVRLSAIDLTRAELESGTTPGEWHTLFESTPCLPLLLENRPFFRGLEMGGRIAQLDEATVLVTVGDHEFDGVNAPGSFAQDSTVSYGKTFSIDLDTGEARAFTFGHRNPQGLFVDEDGSIWSTEHGPRGGDELNRLSKGLNYGWPIATYGVSYGTNAWPLNPSQGYHQGFEQPVFAWVPSIGISAMTSARGSAFERWGEDLLVGSLTGRTLWRVRLDGGRVLVTEPIPLGDQVRDVLVGHNGELLIMDEQLPGPLLLVIQPAAVTPAMPAAFASCAECHMVGDGTRHAIGPDLGGVVGGRVASRSGFSYSTALAGRQGEWTADRLHEFLSDPAAFAPGTSMAVPGVRDRQDRQRIIQYLLAASRSN